MVLTIPIIELTCSFTSNIGTQQSLHNPANIGFYHFKFCSFRWMSGSLYLFYFTFLQFPGKTAKNKNFKSIFPLPIRLILLKIPMFPRYLFKNLLIGFYFKFSTLNKVNSNKGREIHLYVFVVLFQSTWEGRGGERRRGRRRQY